MADHYDTGLHNKFDSDSTKKKTPVDTVALKSRIKTTDKKMSDDEDHIETDKIAYTEVKSGKEAQWTRNNKLLSAQQDTLDNARKGKIPAKP